MLDWLRRLLTPPAPKRGSVIRALNDLDERLEGLESRVEKHYEDFKSLRGLLYALRRGEKDEQEAPGSPNGEGGSIPLPPRRAVLPTAHLAHRFRRGG